MIRIYSLYNIKGFKPFSFQRCFSEYFHFPRSHFHSYIHMDLLWIITYRQIIVFVE